MNLNLLMMHSLIIAIQTKQSLKRGLDYTWIMYERDSVLPNLPSRKFYECNIVMCQIN